MGGTGRRGCCRKLWRGRGDGALEVFVEGGIEMPSADDGRDTSKLDTGPTAEGGAELQEGFPGGGRRTEGGAAGFLAPGCWNAEPGCWNAGSGTSPPLDKHPPRRGPVRTGDCESSSTSSSPDPNRPAVARTILAPAPSGAGWLAAIAMVFGCLLGASSFGCWVSFGREMARNPS